MSLRVEATEFICDNDYGFNAEKYGTKALNKNNKK
jgi:hypothetical protein